jgi:glycosyltransferase involved in cell wall biosynthesis
MNSTKPLVSISCITFNHANYIRDALDGFLIQKTNFPFEILIHDDASTDGTTEIVREYEAKYPDIMKPLYETENQWSKGIRGSTVFNFPRARGKYIALCEGDDYWTDPYKLQKQVDFLEANEDYAGCSHNTRIIYDDSGKDDTLTVNSAIKDSYTIDDITKGHIYFHTSSMVYRNIFKGNFPKKYLTDYIGDWFLLIAHADIGPIKYIDNVMSVYRIHANGIWSNLSDIEQIEKNLTAIIVFNKAFEYKYEENFLSLFTRTFLNICKDKDYEFYAKFFIKIASSDLLKIIFYAYKDILEKDNTIRTLENNLNSKTEEINRMYSAHSTGHNIVARLRATWPGRVYINHLKQYVFFRWIAQWFWRN